MDLDSEEVSKWGCLLFQGKKIIGKRLLGKKLLEKRILEKRLLGKKITEEKRLLRKKDY